MLRVGLSGGIGAGKSTVARRLVEHGAFLIDSDVIAREVVMPGSPGLAELVDCFGADILDEQGALDRPAMAGRVFNDAQARAELNSIVHPRIGARTAELMTEAPTDSVLVHDVPLLVEAEYGPGYHLVVIVDAPVEDRVRRLISRGLNEGDARARIDAQATEAQRRAAADVWLANSGSEEDVLSEVDDLWADRLVPFEANVRLRRRVPQRPPRLVTYEPEWSREAQRLMDRIKLTAGPSALRVDHVGSTAVPGLDSKDIIDLQLTVPSMDVADELAEPLADAGFPVVPEIKQDSVHPNDPDPGQWRKRTHSAADPGRYVNLHLREAGTAGWRFAFLLRDWLRAEPSQREDYLRFKRDTAEKHALDGTPDGYVVSKQPWFEQALPKAAEWAARTGWEPPEY